MTFDTDVLAFGPHPDDVELFCGGLLSSMSAKGYRVVVVDLTRGEKASRGTPELRAKETAAASRVMGLAARENLDLPDTWVSPWTGFDAPEPERIAHSAVARVVSAIRRRRPEIVVVPWERERHPDHEAASALITRAIMLSSVKHFATDPATTPCAPRQVMYYPMRQLRDPTVIVDVSEVYGRKLAAVGCYASQVQPRAGEHATLVGSALALPSLEARDRFYGAMIGVEHGEPYILREAVGLHDPVDHFRRNTFQKPLYFPERS